MPRPRNAKNDDLPANLYESRGYFTWIHPDTKARFPLGKITRAEAIDEANETNESIKKPVKLAQRVAERSDKPKLGTLADFLPAYRKRLETAELAEVSRYRRERHLIAIQGKLGDVLIGPSPEDGAEVTRRTSVFLTAYANAGKRQTARALRSTLRDLYATMCSAGLLTINPGFLVKLPPAKITRERLTLDTFTRIYEAAAALDPWVQRSMALALVTLQRRNDVARMTFRSVEDGRLRVEQQKTGTRLRIPLELRLQAVGWSVGEVIAQCRDAVLSRSLIHHTRHQGRAKPGDVVQGRAITDAFAEARKLAQVDAEEGRRPPSFHELRSLGARLYKQQGYDPQGLLGHKQASTTAVYLDNRNVAWIDVAA